ncbi:hypothetical protein EVJ50_05685 [Synechococcus sp. RSCCF101]|uniref:sulfotransferase family 2 domain-containing protein n=1 Tax=Synechococcus sp. RSCCF101 TaxID=2511069 RepID=UPI001245F4E3|nr:sulfotransferase family 2 domain-containing protein [Synechococcus sp. RSCCF101]QEY31808.1 hypothetical protein EVJ50_05685 [Synechococcus sp. RSCCF101]
MKGVFSELLGSHSQMLRLANKPNALQQVSTAIMIICNSREYIFIHLHKTGGSSLEIAVEPTLKWNDLLLGSTPIGEELDKYYLKKFKLHKHSSLSEVLATCENPNFHNYRYLSIVRHPLERALSLFRFISGIIDKYSINTGLTLPELSQDYDNSKHLFWPLQWPAGEAYIKATGDLNEFFKQDALKRERAMKTQYSQLALGSNLPEQLRIIKLEELASCKNVISDYTGKTLAIPHENKSSPGKACIESLSEHSLGHLREIFAEDYLAFNYA